MPECYDFIELTVSPSSIPEANPFTSTRLAAHVTPPEGEPFTVEGFCDSEDGSACRIRIMPRRAGRHTYRITYRDGKTPELSKEGFFDAVAGSRKGIVKADPDFPRHFIWEGTGEHYFLNGTTCYYLPGWKDEGIIRREIDRLADFGVNRIRVLVYGRQFDNPWQQPVRSTDEFSMLLNPWQALFPDDPTNPEYDLTRFRLEHWRKYERLLAYARERDIVVSVVMFIGGQVLPTPFGELSEDEYRYYRYAAARFSAYANIAWDLGNEHDFHRTVPYWANNIGGLMRRLDPYGHLVGAHNKFYTGGRKSWTGVQLLQKWDAGLNAYLLERLREQEATGYIIPHVIDEYGYEDLWESFPGHRAADTRRRYAWDVYMAGAYQTNGETAERGTGEREDTGGGWVSGRGDSSMTMLQRYRHIVAFFTSFQWWKALPLNELVIRYDVSSSTSSTRSALCYAEEGKAYAVYLPNGGSALLSVASGEYAIERWNPRTGERIEIGRSDGPRVELGPCPDDEDWAFLVRALRVDEVPDAETGQSR